MGDQMDRESFAVLVARTLEEVIVLAEETTHKKLPRRFAFQWLGKAHPRVTENIVEHIMQRIYIDSEHIRPCVDIGVGDLLEDGTLLIVANVAGYEPCAFQRNWTGREGPFVYIVGSPFMSRMEGKPHSWTPENGSFGFSIPKMNARPAPDI
jgi:hypothetical protein